MSFSKVHESFEAPPEGTEERYMRPETKKMEKKMIHLHAEKSATSAYHSLLTLRDSHPVNRTTAAHQWVSRTVCNIKQMASCKPVQWFVPKGNARWDQYVRSPDIKNKYFSLVVVTYFSFIVGVETIKRNTPTLSQFHTTRLLTCNIWSLQTIY